MARRHAQGLLRWIITVAVLLLIVGAAGFGVYRYARPVVTVTEVVEGPVVQAFYSTGTIEPLREYSIKSSTAGTVTEIRVDKGDRVTKGQALAVVTEPALLFTAQKTRAELEERLLRADEKTSPVLNEYDARLKGAQDLLEIAQREFKRVSDLMELNAGAQNDLDRAMDRVKQLLTDAEAIRAQKAAKKLELDREVEVARSAVNIANWNVEQQTLRSPIDGVVLDRPTSLGTRVAVNDPIMRIADVAPANLVMRADVDEEDIASVSEGQTVRMTLYSFPGKVLRGKVTKIYDQADEARRTFEVDVKLDDPSDRLQPGMTGELAFVVATRDKALVIPAQAFQDGGVYVVRDDQLEKATVQIGLKSIERIEVVSGLAPGVRVVITPATTMRVGQIVRTKYMDPVAAAGLNKPPPIVEAFKSFGH